MSQTPALLRATPPDRIPTGGGPVGLYVDTAKRAELLIGAITSLNDADTVLARARIARHQLRELEHDDEIAGALDTRRDAVIGTPWHLDPPTGRNATFVQDELTPHMPEIIRGAWQAVPYGYSVMESVWVQRPNGRIGIASIGERPMEWFRLYRDGRVTMKANGQPAGGGTDELELDLLFKHFVTKRNPTWRNPQGEALLSRLYWAWHFRHNMWRYWMTFLERFGSPILIGKAHNAQALANALVAMGASAAVSVGTDEEVSAVTQGVGGEFAKADDALSRRVQKLVLGQTLTTDVGSTGSFAAAKVHNAVREDKRQSDVRLVSATVQNVLNALWWLNRFPGPPPVFHMGDEAGLQPERADRDAKLKNAGIISGFSEDYILRAYDFEEGDIVMPDPNAAPPQLPGQPPPPGQEDDEEPPPGEQALQLAVRSRFTRRQREIEGMADAALDAAGQPIDPELIRSAIRASRSPADLAERLALLLPELPGGTFDAVLSSALFAADIVGYAQEASGGPVLDSIGD